MAVSRSSTKSSTKATPAPKSSATTEYSGIKKRSGAKKPPPADRKHKQSKPSKPAERTMYIVTRETIDYHNDPRGGLQDKDIVGIFPSRNKANKAARADLLNEWNMDFFESYEVDEEDGLVTVTAVCPEGEEMTVTVEEGQLDEGHDEESDKELDEGPDEESDEESDEGPDEESEE